MEFCQSEKVGTLKFRYTQKMADDCHKEKVTIHNFIYNCYLLSKWKESKVKWGPFEYMKR